MPRGFKKTWYGRANFDLLRARIFVVCNWGHGCSHRRRIPGHQVVKGVPQILSEMPAIRHLLRLRGSGGDGLAIAFGTIAADHRNPAVCGQPLRHRLRLSVGEDIHDMMSFEIDKDGIAVTLAKRPIVNPHDARADPLPIRGCAQHPENRHRADVHPSRQRQGGECFGTQVPPQNHPCSKIRGTKHYPELTAKRLHHELGIWFSAACGELCQGMLAVLKTGMPHRIHIRYENTGPGEQAQVDGGLKSGNTAKRTGHRGIGPRRSTILTLVAHSVTWRKAASIGG